MMDNILNVGMNGALLIGIWWLYFIGYRRYRVDKMRQELFAIRDKFFMETEGGSLSFDSRAYGMTRQLLNGMIRYSHEVSMIQIGSMISLSRMPEGRARAKSFEAEYESALCELSHDGKKAVIKARRKAHEVLIKHLLLNSLPVLLVVIVSSIVFLSFDSWKKLAHGKKTRSQWATFDAEVEKIGSSTQVLAH